MAHALGPHRDPGTSPRCARPPVADYVPSRGRADHAAQHTQAQSLTAEQHPPRPKGPTRSTRLRPLRFGAEGGVLQVLGSKRSLKVKDGAHAVSERRAAPPSPSLQKVLQRPKCPKRFTTLLPKVLKGLGPYRRGRGETASRGRCASRRLAPRLLSAAPLGPAFAAAANASTASAARPCQRAFLLAEQPT